jgi:hypothetical protein
MCKVRRNVIIKDLCNAVRNIALKSRYDIACAIGVSCDEMGRNFTMDSSFLSSQIQETVEICNMEAIPLCFSTYIVLCNWILLDNVSVTNYRKIGCCFYHQHCSDNLENFR